VLAVSRQLSRNLSGMSASGIIIRQLGSVKIGNDFPAVVQVKKIARHDEPRYEKRFLAAFDRVRNHHTYIPAWAEEPAHHQNSYYQPTLSTELILRMAGSRRRSRRKAAD
jgi:hypothetical protein